MAGTQGGGDSDRRLEEDDILAIQVMVEDRETCKSNKRGQTSTRPMELS